METLRERRGDDETGALIDGALETLCAPNEGLTDAVYKREGDTDDVPAAGDDDVEGDSNDVDDVHTLAVRLNEVREHGVADALTGTDALR